MAEVTMPRLSDTMEEGTISSWLKHPGDQVKKGDVIAQIETDKATMDLTAFEAGTLQEILAPEGSTVAIGKPVARIGSGAASSAPAQAPPSSGKAPPTPAEAAPPAAAATGSQQPQTREARENVAEAPEPTASPSVPTTFERQAVSAPVARKRKNASRLCSTKWDYAACKCTVSRTNFPAASGSVSASPAPWCCARAWLWPMSQSPRLTFPSARKSWSCCRICSAILPSPTC